MHICRLFSERSAELTEATVSSLLDSTLTYLPEPSEALLEFSYTPTDSKDNSNLLDNKKFRYCNLLYVHLRKSLSNIFGNSLVY